MTNIKAFLREKRPCCGASKASIYKVCLCIILEGGLQKEIVKLDIQKTL